MRYDHTQYAPLYLIVGAVAILLLVVAWSIPDREAELILVGVSTILLVLAASFRSLTVRDEHDHLRIEFGLLPLFRRRVPYADIVLVERGRSSVMEGWGIHWTPTNGWIWNLWGFDCVDLQLSRGRKLRIGTNDPQGLERFLHERIAERDQT